MTPTYIAKRRRFERLRLAARTESLRAELGVTAPHVELVHRLPSAREVERARAEHDALRASARRIVEQRADEKARAEEAEARIHALEAGGDVQTEERLGDVRRGRDDAHVRLVQSEEDESAVSSLAQELAAREQDDARIADRLRLEAHRVSSQHEFEETGRGALSHEARRAQGAEEERARLAAFEEAWR